MLKLIFGSQRLAMLAHVEFLDMANITASAAARNGLTVVTGLACEVRDEFIAVLRRALRRVPCFLKDGQSFARFLFPNPTAVLLFFISQSFEETSPLKSRLFSQALPEVISGRLNCIGFACPACKVPVILLPILSLPGEFALLA